MRPVSEALGALALCVVVPLYAAGQSPAATPAGDDRAVQMEQKLKDISAAMVQTQQQLVKSQQQVLELQNQMLEVRKQLAAIAPAAASAEGTSSSSLSAAVAEVREQQEIVQAEVKQHDQIKVESESKYPVRVTGLVLFNAFTNSGTVDNVDLPSVALSTVAGTSNRSTGAGFRQTILGLEGTGPRLWGARSTADVNIDFYASVAYAPYGTSAGTVRMRTASVNLDWENNFLHLGLVGPLISPLSPASYATVAEPAMAWAGNLWTWVPQLSYEHRIPLSTARHIGMEFGLMDTPSAGYNPNELQRTATPGELSGQPGYESRISWAANEQHGAQVGLGGYYSRQSYPANEAADAYAVTTDWRLPFAKRFELSGEAYRGRSLGGLGGGVYKDILIGTYPGSTVATYVPLNDVGGWSQWKSKFSQLAETNVTFGQDNGFAGDFHSLVLPSTASATQLRARNRMLSANLIFRPKTYLIFSPEYRRIWTWGITGPANTADIFTLTVGYQF